MFVGYVKEMFGCLILRLVYRLVVGFCVCLVIFRNFLVKINWCFGFGRS